MAWSRAPFFSCASARGAVGGGIARVQLEGCVEVGDRAVDLADRKMGLAAEDARVDQLCGLNSTSLSQSDDRPPEFALLLVARARLP